MSQYRSLSLSGKEWVFKREEPFVSADDREQIKLLGEVAGANIWRDYVSDSFLYPDLFSGDVWVKNNIVEACEWEQAWESDEDGVPDMMLSHLENWGDDTRVYFCCHADLVLETTWVVFKRAWKAFLFLESDAVLVGKKKKQAIQFCEDGRLTLLVRPS